MQYRCKECGKLIDATELDRETFAPEICHPIKVEEGNDWWIEPCGPVMCDEYTDGID